MTAQPEFGLDCFELSASDATLDTTKIATRLPSCIEMGLQASKKGDFARARQMFRAAIKLLENRENNQTSLIALIVNIADTYLNEGRYETAKHWYTRAIQRSESLARKNILPFACLLTRLAQINVLQNNMPDFQKTFEDVQRVYLLSQEGNSAILLDSLIDLSWVLCVQGHL